MSDQARLLDGDHLARVAAAACGELYPSPAEREVAQTLWWKGYDLYAYMLLLHGEAAAGAYVQARERFLAAVQADPGLADGFAALLLLGGPGAQRRALAQALALTAARFGEEQRRSGRILPLQYRPLLTSAPVRDADDARLVYALTLAVEESAPFPALAWTERCCAENARVRAVHGFLALESEQWADGIDLLTSIADDRELGRDALFLTGVAWESCGADDDARDCFERALARSNPADEITLDVRYALANLHERCGDEQAARLHLADIAARNPDYADVAERLGLDEVPVADEQEWQTFLASLAQ